MEPPLRRLHNEQIMMGGAAPPSIRELAEQSYALREHDLRENSVRKQRDDTLFRRSMDPRITHNRENTPSASTMPKYTKEGIIKRNVLPTEKVGPDDIENMSATTNGEENADPEASKKPVQLHRGKRKRHHDGKTSKSYGTLLIVLILIAMAIAGVVMLCSSKPSK